MTLFNKCILTLFTLVSLHCHAASVWKVSKGSNILYIGGTIHILSPGDYPLPAEYEKAYQGASKIVFETDMAAVNSIDFQQKLMSQLTYSDGTTLDKVLKPETYQALKQHLAKRNIPIEAMATLKPSLVAITLSVIELQALGFTSEGVDQFYANKATQDEKLQGWFETPDEQIAFLVGLGKEDESAMIDYTLLDIKKLAETVNSMRRSWREGDMDELAKIAIDEFKADYPKIYQDLLVNRNNNWFPQIVKMLNDKPVEFIMVGAMHLAGPDSVLAKLSAKGYKIEKL